MGVSRRGTVLFLLALALFAFTATPTVSWQDSGELAAAAYTLGIAHHSGYPTWTILAKAMTFIPIGSIAYRVALLSCIFGAVSVALAYSIVLHLTENKPASVFSALALMLSFTFWSQAIIPEVYTLHIFFLFLTVWLLLKWRNATRWKYLYWLAFIIGVSLTNHIDTVLWVPAIIIFILLHERRFSLKKILLIPLLLLVGLSPFLYLPLRSAMEPMLDWGDPETPTRFYEHLTGANFAGQYLASPKQIPWNIMFFIQILFTQFPYLLPLPFIGLYWLWKKQREHAVLLIALLIPCTLFAFMYSDNMAVFSLPVYALLALLIGPGALQLFRWLEPMVQRKHSHYLWPLLFLLLVPTVLSHPREVSQDDLFILDSERHRPLLYFKLYPHQTNYRGDYGAAQYAQYILDSLPQNAVLFTQYDEDTNPVIYFQFVENRRRDIIIVHKHLVTQPWYIEQLNRQHPELGLEVRGYAIEELEQFLPQLYDCYRIDMNPMFLSAFNLGYSNVTLPISKI